MSAEHSSHAAPDAEEILPEEPEDLSVLTPIQNKYTFWYRCDLGDKGKVQKHNYSDSIKKIASFQSIERFWSIYDYLKRPHDFKNAEFHLFKEGIRPFWEDAQNKAGGKWSVRLPKGIASRYWEDIVLAIIGEQFDVGYEICGAVVSVRSNEDIISVWNKTADNKEAVEKIRDQIRKFVRLPAVIPIEYKRHQMSLEEGSSYKNPNMVWRPPVKSNAGGHFHGNYNQHHHQGGSGGGGYDRNAHGEHANKPFYRNNYNANPNHPGSGSGGVAEGASAPKPGWKSNRWENHEGQTGGGSGWRKGGSSHRGPNAAEGGEGSHAATAAPTATAPPAPTVAGASSTSASSTMAAAPTAIPPAPISSATAHPPRSYASSAAAPSTNPPPAAPASAPSMQGWTRVSNPFSKNT